MTAAPTPKKMMMMHWPSEDLWLALAPLLPGLSVEVLREIDSTNTELMRRARAGSTSHVLMVAERQTAGRGRMGRPWSNAPGDSLMFSLGLPLAPQQWAGLSLAIGLAVAQAVQPDSAAITAPERRLGLKWPNDLWLYNGCKLGGILIETANLPQASSPGHRPSTGSGHSPWTGSGQRYVVIGIGLNVRPPAPQQPDAPAWSTPAACLQDLDGRWTAQTALSCIAPVLLRQVLRFAQTGFAPFAAEFAQVDVLLDQPLHTSCGLHGTGRGVDAEGALLLEAEDGHLHAVYSNEVSVRPQGMALPAPISAQH